MKKLLLIALLSIINTLVHSQTKTVIVTKSSTTVPAGKKWKIEADIPIKIQVGYGVSNSGSFCNAMFLSTPRMIWNLNRGSIYEAESFGIIFKNLNKVPYTNDATYSITPISFIDKTFSLSKLQTASAEKVGIRKLEFFAGESVFIGNCLESIELVEVNMTQNEILALKNKAVKAKVQELAIASNFHIPINTGVGVQPGTKPQIHDTNLKYIVLTSSAVLWKKPGKGSAVDESKWTLTLTQKDFEMRSSNYTKRFKVLGSKFDEDFQMQRFALADETGKHTFDLLISYSPDSKDYSVIVGTIDNEEEYQFQEVIAKEKELQSKF